VTSTSHTPKSISRREFLKLAAAGTVGLLAGCSPASPSSPTATSPPTDLPVPADTVAPTSTPTATETPELTVTPEPAVDVGRPDIIETYPDVPSKVIRAQHAGVWDGDDLVPAALREMLDGSMTALTGLDSAGAAWAALFAPDERVAIKVNAIRSSSFWTHVPLVMAVVESLREAGVPGEQIAIFDRSTLELENAGYPVNKDGAGARCCGTDLQDKAGWQLMGTDIKLSNILLSCHALINIPILKQHSMAGISFAMKNHYGTFDKPSSYHQGDAIQRGMAELNALPPIRDRTRLIIGDVLNIVKSGGRSAITGDSILMSFDPVAHDTIGLQLFSEAMTSEGLNSHVAVAKKFATPWLENGAGLGLGTGDLNTIELMEINL
jgi:hypothetical protein